MDKITTGRCLKIFCLVAVLSFCSCKTFNQQITRDEAQEIKNICATLEPPPFFALASQDELVKSQGAVYTLKYSSSATTEQVEEYYVNLLTKKGWSYREEDAGVKDVLLFKKQTYSVRVYSPWGKPMFSRTKAYSIECSVGIDFD